MHLNETEFFVAFVFQDFAEEANVVVVPLMRLDAINNRYKPLNNQVLQPVLLVQVGVHVLLHGLATLLRVLTFFVKLYFLCVDVVHCIS